MTAFEEISIFAYDAIGFSEWLSSHESLLKLSLSKHMNCKHLPLLNRLNKLSFSSGWDGQSGEYFRQHCRSTNNGLSIPERTPAYQLSETRQIWWKVAIGVEETKFLCLSKLKIEDCPRLNSMPLFPHLEDLLLLKNTRWEPFQHTIRRQQIPSRTTAAEASSSTSSANPTLDLPLSKLRTLCIIQLSDGDTDMWQYLQSLRSLTLDHLSNVETLLERLPHVTSLQELHISRCDCLSQITAWISDLKSLRKLSVRLCPSLTIPLDQIGLVTSLQNVEIEDCPKIVELWKFSKDSGVWGDDLESFACLCT